MSNGFRKRPEKAVTKKYLKEKVEHMASLMIAMEQALTEWEIWHQLLGVQSEGLTTEEYIHVVKDGPIFSDLSSKIVESIKQQLPVDLTPPSEEEMTAQDRPALFDASGNIIEKKKVPLTIVDGMNENNDEETETEG